MKYGERQFVTGFKAKGTGRYQAELAIPPYSCPNKIRLLGSQKDWSIPKLAEALGCSRGAVYAIETGKSFPRKDKVKKLCEIFDCEAGELFWTKPECGEIYCYRCGVTLGYMPLLPKINPRAGICEKCAKIKGVNPTFLLKTDLHGKEVPNEEIG